MLESDLPGLTLLCRGKVRDVYDLGKTLLFVATDRISAYDVVLPEGIPGKGYVLTQFSLFWFDWLSAMSDFPEHHLLTADFGHFPECCQPYRDVLEGRSLIVRKLKPLPVECIVRGYLAGSGWKEYREKGAVSGEEISAGLLESERLSEPIFTPSTKALLGDHDVNISFSEMRSLIGSALSERVRHSSLLIFKKASDFALKRGIIIADTKMEFGVDPETGALILMDELLTPDSSRFWPLSDYMPGKGQKSFDKQFVRDYLKQRGWKSTLPVPNLPEKIVEQTSEKYFEALERLTA